MCLKKCMAVLLSVALALCLVLTGCGGSGPLTEVILDLLDGYYKNIAVDSDPDLEKALREAVDQGGTEEEILARIINSMNLTGSSIQFTRLGDGQQGDHALDVVFQLGTDPDAAARQAMAEWSRIFGSLPSDGQYEAHVSMVEENGGYYVAVDVTVVKAGRSNQDDEEDGPVVLTEISVSGKFKIEYHVGQTFDRNGMVVTAYYSNSTSKQVTGYTVSPEKFETEGSITVTITYEESNIPKTATVTVTVGPDPGYTTTTDSQGNITGYSVYNEDGLRAWAEAATNNPYLNCTLTDNITLTSDWTPISSTFAGTFDGNNKYISGLKIRNTDGNKAGLFAQISGTVKDLELRDVDIEVSVNRGKYVGAVAGYSTGTIENCVVSGTVTGNGQGLGFSVGGVVGGSSKAKIIGCSSTASVTGDGQAGRVGGIVGSNMSSSYVIACYHTGGAITGDGTGNIYAGGVVGRNVVSQVTACYASCNVNISNAQGNAGGVIGYDDGGSYNACYWAGTIKEGTAEHGWGVGNNSAHTGATKVGDGVTWIEAVERMNEKLSEEGISWKFAQDGDKNSLPTLSK
ncbi:bacterial Ig-like domain-containing protein [Faecalibacterium sp. An122]|uniref:bacterial Ig-like domain-containing protein n=1 Tax=Faecalibacterium sp. An122 TaxID=1965551 RepID=UPI000B36A7F8|nr:bacterial Ig-like domain-containing protein [Faecalibacterium sp. An122]OUQ39046.1 hypothetical protein B5E67_03985 [Faecalibacterium sp. An122]